MVAIISGVSGVIRNVWNAADSPVNGNIHAASVRDRSFFQQFCARLDFARFSTEVKRIARIRCVAVYTARHQDNQRAAVDVQPQPLNL